MLGNLKAPPEPFADIIRTHFRLKAKSITEQLDAWLAQDDGKATTGDATFVGKAVAMVGGSGNSFQKDVDELKRRLKDLEREGGAGKSGSSSGMIAN